MSEIVIAIANEIDEYVQYVAALEIIKEKVMDKKTALYDIDQLENAISFEQELIERKIYETERIY